MGGMMTSWTNELTMVPKAAPMMIPTAISTTFPRIANSLNSFSIDGSSSSVEISIDFSPVISA
jgi:hypothetical protein